MVENPRGADGDLAITWIGHATCLLQLGALNVLTDPMWSHRASPVSWAGPARVAPVAMALESLPPIDIVLISHNHYDHLDRDTVRRLARQHPAATWCVPLGVARLVRRWGAADVRELDWWDTVRVGAANLMCTPARHFSSRGLHDRNATLWAGWTIQAEGCRVFFAGDTAYHPEFSTIARHAGPFDLVMLPVGAYDPRWMMASVHMNPEEAVRGFQDIAAADGAAIPAMVPIHWGTFRLTDEPLDEPPRRLRAAWAAAGLRADRLWVLAHGETQRRGRPG
jgi:N-acyl-phosphatidylethanolamine-hydrolysing phospholipase D